MSTKNNVSRLPSNDWRIVTDPGVDHLGRKTLFSLIRYDGTLFRFVPVHEGRANNIDRLYRRAAEIAAKEARWEAIYQESK